MRQVLDTRLRFSYHNKIKIPLVRGRLSRRYPGMRSGYGARGPRPYTLAPGRPGHHACRHYDRRVRCSLDWDRLARVTPRAARGLRPRLGGLNRNRTLRPHPRKPGSGRASGDVSPPGESRGGTPGGGRARFARAAPLARRFRQHACRRSASFLLQWRGKIEDEAPNRSGRIFTLRI